MPTFGSRSPSRHGPGGYRGAMQAAARAQFSAERHAVVNANIKTEPAEKCPEQKESPKPKPGAC